jgi:hypothetical protein
MEFANRYPFAAVDAFAVAVRIMVVLRAQDRRMEHHQHHLQALPKEAHLPQV